MRFLIEWFMLRKFWESLFRYRVQALEDRRRRVQFHHQTNRNGDTVVIDCSTGREIYNYGFPPPVRRG